jgi:GT2 family glycosyltransferase
MSYTESNVSIIVPCLFRPELSGMIAECMKGLGIEHQVIFISNDSYAKNVNNAVKATTGNYLVICNNDIEFIQADWLDHLLKPLDEGYGISSIRTTEPDGWIVEDRYEEGAKFGSLWALTKRTYYMIGPLDESFGNYFEDLDYWRRAKERGIKIVKNHNGLVEHKGKATFKLVDPKDTQYEKAKQRYLEKYGALD